MGEGIVPRPSDCDRCRELLGRLAPGHRERLESRVRAALESSTREAALFGATAELAELTGSERCSALVPCGRAALRVVASSESRDIGDLLVSLDRYPELAWLLEHGEAVLISDVTSDPILTGVRELMHHTGIVSLAAAPVKLGHLDGILRLLSRQRKLGEADLDLLVTASHLAEHVIEATPEPPPADWRWTELALEGWDLVLEVRADGRLASLWGAPERLGLEPSQLEGRLLDELLAEADAEQPWLRVLELLQQPGVGRFVLACGDVTRAVTARSTEATGPVGNVLVALEAAPESGDHPAISGLEVPLPLLTVDSRGVVQAANRALVGLLGTSRELVIGRRLDEIVTGDPEAAVAIAPGGRPVPVTVRRAPVSEDEKGFDIVGLVDRRVEADIQLREASLRTAVRRQLDEIEQLNKQLDTLEAARATFLSASAHEFKTPLTVIQSYLEILLNDLSAGLTPEQLSFLRITFDSVLRLRRLVVDLVDLAAMESGRIQLEIGEVDLRPLIATVLEELRPLAQRANVTLSQVVAGSLSTVRADADRVQQVLRNLLDNAIKYTPTGGRVSVETSLDGDSVVVSICDTGIGIPQDQLSAIFDEFYRADHTGLGRRHGAGLGLTISRRIMRALGGRIAVESTSGHGSRFSVHLPRWPRADGGG